MSVLYFKSIGRKALWGTTKVKEYFHYDWFDYGVGQSWSFSTQPGEGCSNICLSDPYKGMTLKELWADHQEIFGHPGEDFPVLISLVGPDDDLSVQIHPDTPRAKKLGFNMGKNEAWFFIDSEPGASIVFGHKAHDEAELRKMIAEDRWDDLLKRIPVETGDFVYLPSLTLHAMGKRNLVYEIQQSTDVTYRFYDYKRRDENGNERKLNLEEAIECLTYKKDADPFMAPKITIHEHCKESVYVDNESFTVTQLLITGPFDYQPDNYQLATVVKGEGKVDGRDVITGNDFVIPINEKVHFDGQMMIMMTTRR